MSQAEVRQHGWDELDIIFVTGDAYIDHPAFGVPLLARWLEAHGFRVGIIAQPDWRSKEPFMTLGRPRLFFAVSAGAMDSMVAHYTPARKLRHDDAYTPGNIHGARPNRAIMVYTSRLKEAYKDVPVVIGGIEASLRRFAHYDFWEDKVRRSILFDSKADLLIYGMAERALLEVALRAQNGENFAGIRDVRGTACVGRNVPDSPLTEIPSFEKISGDKISFATAFRLAYQEQNPWSGRTVIQHHADRVLVCNPPAQPLTEKEMDAVYALPFQKAPHPSYQQNIPAWEQIKLSITSHRGCFGGCAFCAITMHQGKTIQSRSEASVLAEVDSLAGKSWFRGSISDVGGPTANMYGLGCGNPSAQQQCVRESCVFPSICPNLRTSDTRVVSLLKKVRARPAVKHVVVSSGVRYDLMERQERYFHDLVAYHVGGLLKVAPEHLSSHVTRMMRKPGGESFERFLARFREENRKIGKRLKVIPYLMSGHPGCTLDDMVDLALALKRLGLTVEQVQDFTPTPGTVASCMYYSGIDPMSGKQVYVARSDREKGVQKSLLLAHIPEERNRIRAVLRDINREDVAGLLLGAERFERKKAVTGVRRRDADNGVKKGIKKTR